MFLGNFIQYSSITSFHKFQHAFLVWSIWEASREDKTSCCSANDDLPPTCRHKLLGREEAGGTYWRLETCSHLSASNLENRKVGKLLTIGHWIPFPVVRSFLLDTYNSLKFLAFPLPLILNQQEWLHLLNLFERESEEKQCPLPFQQISINVSSSWSICQHTYREALLYWTKDIDMWHRTQEFAFNKSQTLSWYTSCILLKILCKTGHNLCKYVGILSYILIW